MIPSAVLLRAEILAARLQDLGIATSQQLAQAQQELAKTQERFSAILTRQGITRDPEVGKRLSMQVSPMPQPSTDVPSAQRIPIGVWRSHRLIPVREVNGTLLLATDDPLSVFALDFFQQQCECTLEAVLVSEQDFALLLNAVDRRGRTTGAGAGSSTPSAAEPPPSSSQPTAPSTTVRSSSEGRSRSVEGATASARPGLSDGAAVARDATDDAPIIQLVDSILSEAVRMRASDIHLEPSREQIRLRYRIDGVLRDINSPPKALLGPLVSRIKIMSNLNIAEKRLPQDGRMQLTVDKHQQDVRISLLPSVHGESIVMRLLDRSQPIRGLAEMGMLAKDQQAWEELIHHPHGMMLVTGPTGSGKTTTLYGALSILNQVDRKLISVEDPVEYQLSGVNQVSVKPAIGLTFAAGLRAMLRQAPDVIMVGEIRDPETAQIAIQAALTGHLVLSTLHTNDAASAITRLIDMGIAPFLVASTLQGVLAQRLIRRVCPACRITDNATAEEHAFLGEPEMTQVIRSNGCEKCHRTGFYGRVGLFELLVMSAAIRQLIVAKASASAIRACAVREGMRSLREDGGMKIREGLTTMAEVLRVIADIGGDTQA